MITWSKDQTLRIWEVDKYLQEVCILSKTSFLLFSLSIYAELENFIQLCGPMNNDVDVDCVDYASDVSRHNNSIIDTELFGM